MASETQELSRAGEPWPVRHVITSAALAQLSVAGFKAGTPWDEHDSKAVWQRVFGRGGGWAESGEGKNRGGRGSAEEQAGNNRGGPGVVPEPGSGPDTDTPGLRPTTGRADTNDECAGR